jgi:hypothetical protein
VTRIRTGLLIIRAWDEPGSSSPLRTQIRLTADVSQGFERSLTVAEEEAVVEVVRVWLSERWPTHTTSRTIPAIRNSHAGVALGSRSGHGSE